MFAGLWGWLVAALGAVAGIGGVWLSGRKSGAAEVEAETAERTVEAAQTRAATQDEVARTAPSERREELKRWAK
jgi:uncharacterized membrane protein YdjX (TVP38/TMEM64 family)